MKHIGNERIDYIVSIVKQKAHIATSVIDAVDR